MKKVLALVGSGEFTPAMIDIDKFLLSQIKKTKVAIIPTAAGKEEAFDSWIKQGISHFTALGVEVVGINLKTREGTDDPEIMDQLRKCNFYYFSGGDPGYLLDTINNSKAWDLIFKNYENGAILVGSSAGAMALGKKVWGSVYSYDKEGKLLPWDEGLSVVDFGVLPHFDTLPTYFSIKQIEEIKNNLPTDIDIVGIDENTAYVCIDGTWQTMGKGNVHKPAKL